MQSGPCACGAWHFGPVEAYSARIEKEAAATDRNSYPPPGAEETLADTIHRAQASIAKWPAWMFDRAERKEEAARGFAEYENLGADVPAGKKYDADKEPVVQACLHYFPRALKAVATVSAYGKRKYKVEYSDQNWARVENGVERYGDADGRHLLDEAEGPYDFESGVLHAAHHAWDALARLQLMLKAGVPLIDPERGIGPHKQ